MQVEEKEYDGDGFEDENDHDFVVSDRRYEGRLRNQEDNNLGGIKMKIPSFQEKNDLEVYLIVTIILKIRR